MKPVKLANGNIHPYRPSPTEIYIAGYEFDIDVIRISCNVAFYVDFSYILKLDDTKDYLLHFNLKTKYDFPLLPEIFVDDEQLEEMDEDDIVDVCYHGLEHIFGLYENSKDKYASFNEFVHDDYIMNEVLGLSKLVDRLSEIDFYVQGVPAEIDDVVYENASNNVITDKMQEVMHEAYAILKDHCGDLFFQIP